MHLNKLYPREMTEVSKIALAELARALNQYHNDIVVTGGWAPFFITQDHFQHCGSIDIDLALKTDIMQGYYKIREIIEYLGYREAKPFQFKKNMKSVDGNNFEIQLDLLCEPAGAKFAGLHEVQPDLQACIFEGIGLVFDFNFEQPLNAKLPDWGNVKTSIKVADLVGSLALKGPAIYNRAIPKYKDAYDVYALTHYSGGPKQAADYFNRTVSSKQISISNQAFLKNSLTYITDAFRAPDSIGSIRVEEFTENGVSRHVASAYVNLFLSNLH